MIFPAEHAPDQSPRRIARRIVIDSVVDEIVAPTGITFRTRPSIGIARGGARYALKNDSPLTVVAEALGYALAELVHLQVPNWATTVLGPSKTLTFCSEYLDRFDPFDALDRGRVTNPEIVGDALVFDLWIANDDRNLGGFVTRMPETGAAGMVEMLAIDFEAAHILRGKSAIMVNTVNLLPRHEVRRYVSQQGQPYATMCRRISLLSEEHIRDAFERLRVPSEGLFQSLYPDWADGAIKHLAHRATRIHQLVRDTLHA